MGIKLEGPEHVVGVTLDVLQLAGLRHQHAAAARRVEETLSQLERACADLRRDITRRGAADVLITPGNIGAAAARVEAACEAMKTIRDALAVAGVKVER